ncbi:MAG: hypothetical protein NC355_10765 [Blautia sp.]|nr:hypothetical protein [Blautia sp.]
MKIRAEKILRKHQRTKRRSSQRTSKRLAALLSLVLFLGCLPIPAYGEKDSGGEIVISSTEELVGLAEDCHIDDWSRGKTVKLDRDLDFEGEAFAMIPVFAGTFDGQGHTIRGLTFAEDDYVAGFFRHIGAEGTVKNLTLEVAVSGTMEKQCLGGVCGENSGLIENCTFTGVLEGRSETGGIAGRNTATGQIKGCVSDGAISGYYYTGGIVGRNHGIVTGCVNRSAINNSVDWAKIDDENSFDWLQTLQNREENASIQSGVDAGGIAGYSDGILMSCDNSGDVGYEHIGYNIGGIVGRQSGLTSLCSNTGNVYGRKDVGGIAGQMEPDIRVDAADSVEEAIEELHDRIELALLDVDAGNAAIDKSYGELQDYSDAALEKAHILTDQLSGFVDENVESVNQISERLRYVLESLPDVQEKIVSATDAMSEVTKDLSAVNEDLGVIDEMKNKPYAWTGYDRLTLQSGVGGRLATDNATPAANTKVTITSAAENGYMLEQITAMDANGATVPLEKAGEQYRFTMPAANVLVQAHYRYVGAYLVSGTAGGKLSLTENGTALTVTAAPDDGYALTALSIGGKTVETGGLQDNRLTVNKADYPLNGRPVVVYGTFSPVGGEDPGESGGISLPSVGADRYRVTALSANGGRAAVSNSYSEAGASVQILLTPESGYRFKELRVTAGGVSVPCTVIEAGASYRFVMPAGAVTVAAEFEPVQFIMTSNVGGSAGYTVSGDVVTFRIYPLDGFSVSGTPVLTDKNGNRVSAVRTRSDSYTYECRVDAGTEPVFAGITFGGQSEYDALQSAVDTMQSSSADLTAAMNQCKLLVDEMTSLVQDSSGNVVSWENLSDADRDKLLKDIISLAKQISLAGDAAARMASAVSVVSNIVHSYAVDTLEAVHKDFAKLTEDLEKVMEEVSAAERVVSGITDYLNAQSGIRFTGLGQEFDDNMDGLYGDLQNISRSMGSIEKDLTGSIQKLSDDFKAINDQLNVVLLLFIDRIDRIQNPDGANYYQDISDEELSENSDGRVSGSENHGTVRGDINVGGIAGAMSIDEEDPEDNAAGSTGLTVGGTYRTRCVLTDCKNYGYITAKKDGAGGIAGYMTLGVVTDCQAYGGADSTEGEYVGGICGQSLGVIRRCYAMVTLGGASYIGGIAGYGSGVYNCYAITDVTEGQSRVGAIAGQLGAMEKDGSRDAASCAASNYYVGDGLYGIDNVSYAGVAEPISYDKLLQTEGLPADYRHLKVSYIIDDICVSTEEIAYGESLENLHYPEIPEQEGKNGVWPDMKGKTMAGNLRLEAVYEDNISVLESDGGEEYAGMWRAYALLDGVYTAKASLSAVLSDEEPPATLTGGREYRVYQLHLKGGDAGGETTLRLLDPYGEKASVYAYEDGKWKQKKAVLRGSYLQVQMPAAEGIYMVRADGMSFGTKLLLGIGAAAAAVLVLVFFKRLRKFFAQKFLKKK